MIEEFGLDEEAETETYKTISYNDYKKQINKDYSNSDNQIAVITVEGVIMEGEIMQGVAGANGIVNQIRSAHEDENTKAIVFRVNSPGGSVIASEMMRDELIAAKRKGINVIVSMGGTMQHLEECTSQLQLIIFLLNPQQLLAPLELQLPFQHLKMLWITLE